ncbi:MAG TPA: NAD(P)H-binding protein [Puia sp.]|nr:NAD(P)H-binding protein [Puia sp.]
MLTPSSPSGTQPAPSGTQPAPSGTQPAPSGTQPAPSGTLPAPSGAQPAPPGAILIIGAGGGIGRQSVDLALKASHQVTAVLRDPAKLTLTHPNLTVVKGDIFRPETFRQYLPAADLVISAIGVSGGGFGSDKPTTLYSAGNATLIKAMEKAGSRRVFFISASAIEISPVLPFYVRFAEKYIVQRLLRHMYTDLRQMEALIKKSDLDWTIIRPPQLTDKPVTGHYRTSINSFLKNCLKISRADLAHFMIHNAKNEATYQAIVEIGC